MKDYIIDASVALCMALKEDQETVKRMGSLVKKVERRKARLWSTVFFRQEFCNGLRYSDKNKEEILIIWRRFQKLPIINAELERNFLSSVIILSKKLNTTVYDTAYHYLAMILNGTFLTRDKKYYQKAKKLGNIELI